MRGREEESVLASHSAHNSDGFTMETLLHPPPLSPHPPSAVVYLPRQTVCWQVGERQRHRYDDLPQCLLLLLTSPDSLIFDSWHVQLKDYWCASSMQTTGAVAVPWIVFFFFKAALRDFFIWSFGGRGTQHPTYHPLIKQFWQTATYFHIQQTQSTIMIP